MSHTEHILIGLLIGTAGVFYRVCLDGLAQASTLRASKREVEAAIAETSVERQ